MHTRYETEKFNIVSQRAPLSPQDKYFHWSEHPWIEPSSALAVCRGPWIKMADALNTRNHCSLLGL